VPDWAQGRPGMGQGGWSAAKLEAAIGRPVTIDFRAPIPLEEDLSVVETAGGWELRADDRVVMAARPRDVAFAEVEAVSVEAAADARSRFGATAEDHNASACFSCGLGGRTMRVWPGPLADGSGRLATDWAPPEWVRNDGGEVDPAVVWTAMDCVQGFFVGRYPVVRQALTVRYAAEVLAPVRVGARYAVVADAGHWPGGWNGRKRGAAAAVFDEDGNLVARADSLWVAPRDA
jgi:hypothetical protein